jgi:hypothetical protein
VRDQRGQPVVVADADLVGGHGVVLVHHRQHVQAQQPLQGALRVAVVGPADHVVRGEQHLPDDLAVPSERLPVRPGQLQLPDGGGGLLGGEVAGTAGQPERGEPRRDRPGRHQHHLGARGPADGQRVDQRVQPLRVQPTGQARQRRRPDLDDEPARRAQLRAGGHRARLVVTCGCSHRAPNRLMVTRGCSRHVPLDQMSP